jgi:hypothetical protein
MTRAALLEPVTPRESCLYYGDVCCRSDMGSNSGGAAQNQGVEELQSAVKGLEGDVTGPAMGRLT